MRYLITGANGQLGQELCRYLPREDVIAVDKNELDITNEKQVEQFFKNHTFDVVFHCAAFTQVDAAEENKDGCYAVNVLGTKYITKACNDYDKTLVYFSTDYIFDGSGHHFYEVDDVAHPINYYGETKYLGELEAKKVFKHYIVRISWVFGLYGKNFVETMLSLSEKTDVLNIVKDQIGSPTFTYDLVCALMALLNTKQFGTYHITNEGECSWAEFASYIFAQANKKMKVNFITSDQYPTKAKRPQNSRLSKKTLIDVVGVRLPHWKDAVNRYLEWRK